MAANEPDQPSPLSPSERSRLQQSFQRGTQNAAANADYAAEMFANCVVGDPASAIYLQSLLGVLRKKHPPKKGGGLTSFLGSGSKVGGLKKPAAAGQWREVIRLGVEILKGNPYDVPALLAMADACGQLGHQETRGVYLRSALDAAPTDIDVNRQCAKFAAEMGNFDQAIACWVRVSSLKGMAEEAEREIARLQVEKTISVGGGLTGRVAPKAAAPAAGGAEPDRATVLRKTIAAKPTDTEAAYELADLLEQANDTAEAEKVLERALAASGGDIKVREHLEDRQIRWSRQRVAVAEKRAASDPAAQGTLDQLRQAHAKLEVEVFSARSSRYPENTAIRYELGLRLKAARNVPEAIKQFQDVLQNDARRKGVVALELGECFQSIRQYDLAMRNYAIALDALTDREQEQRKRALYRAGVLAAGMGDPDAARKHLSTLAGIDFGYRDVAQRLDKLSSVKDKGGPPTS
ncbi:MAG: tetratricopeptide repeat protein [Planctomycetota bacterium]